MQTKITYARLQEKVATAIGISRREADRLLKEISSTVGNGLVADGKVNLAGLGRFSLKVQSARRGRNPRTGEPIEIPEKNKVHFLPDAKWRRHVNREFEQLAPVPAPDAAAPVVPNTGKPHRTAESSAGPVPKDDRKPEPPPVEVHRPPIPSKDPGKKGPAPATPESTAPELPAADIPSEVSPAKRARKRISSVPAAIVILLVAAALFLLWPRAQSPLPPKPEPIRVAKSERPPPHETPPAQKPAPEMAPQTEPVEAEPIANPIIAVPVAIAAQPETTPPPPRQAGAEPPKVTSYTVAAGDSLWNISDDIYQYAYFWPLIFQENQPLLKHPDTLLIGMRLSIPTFAGRVGQLSENEFQQLADGYLRVYQVYHRNRHPRAPYYLWVAYRLRAHWIPDNDLILGEPEDFEFIRQIRGQGLIH